MFGNDSCWIVCQLVLAVLSGDVVIARSPQNPRHLVCKRVLGLQGDSVKVAATTLLGPSRTVVVGVAFVCPFPSVLVAQCLAPARFAQVDWVQVPEGHIWLQGDNDLNSTDSRHYGPVPYALVEGRAFLKVSQS